MGVAGAGDRVFHAPGVRDVAGEAETADPGADRDRRRLVQIQYRDLRAGPGEPPRGLRPHARAAAGDHGRMSRDVHVIPRCSGDRPHAGHASGAPLGSVPV